jgi:glutaconyl-CoA/methylmalonyl-CoA decarboxylase subunit gamma
MDDVKLEFKLHAGGQSRDEQLELAARPGPRVTEGRLSVAFDGRRAEADWVEIAPGAYSILLGGRSYDVRIERGLGEGEADGNVYTARVGRRVYRLELRDRRRRRHAGTAAAGAGPQEILAPMPGRIVKALVEEGQQVAQGDSLLVIEAMKMQNEIRAPRAGRVEKIYAAEGQGVETGEKLARLI